MKYIFSLFLILTSAFCYSQLSIGIDNTIRKTNIFPLKNEYPLKYEYIPSITCFYTFQNIEYGLKIGLIHHNKTFHQSNYNYWADPTPTGVYSMSSTEVYSSRLTYNIFSTAALLRLKYGRKKRFYLNIVFGYETLINQKESNHLYNEKSNVSITNNFGPNQGTYSSNFDSTNTLFFKGVKSENNFIYSNIGIGYIFPLNSKISINTDAAFGFITNQLIFYKPNDFIDNNSPENLNGSLFLSIGINLTLEKEKKLMRLKTKTKP